MTTADHHILESHDPEAQESGHPNRFMQMLLIAAIAASGISMVFSIGTAVVSASDQQAPSAVAEE